jgi:hypothetical protein
VRTHWRRFPRNEPSISCSRRLNRGARRRMMPPRHDGVRRKRRDGLHLRCIAMPTALKYALAARPAGGGVSRRTPVACSIRRKLQPSRPNASICFCFSSLKTLAILGAADQIRARPSTSRPPHRWPVLIRSPMAGFDRSSRGEPKKECARLLSNRMSVLSRLHLPLKTHVMVSAVG